MSNNSNETSSTDWLQQIKWNADGLVPVIVQDANDSTILMFAWMNQESLAITVSEGYATYWSRSRQRLWRKGEESGHRQHIIELRLDCDHDALLIKVEQIGGIACHTGRRSCFFRIYKKGQWEINDPIIVDPTIIYKH